MAEILPIRRKTLYNQSINHNIFIVYECIMFFPKYFIENYSTVSRRPVKRAAAHKWFDKLDSHEGKFTEST